MVEIIEKYGYQQEGYGYKMQTENVTHWMTPFKDNQFQLYAYYSNDNDLEKIYDTGIITLKNPEDINTLINILTSNHQ